MDLSTKSAGGCCGGTRSAAPEVRSEDQLRALVAGWADQPDIDLALTLLQEQHPLYQGLDTRAVVRARGWLLGALARSTDLPGAALPFVIEELESARDPYLTAQAAVALRRAAPQPAFVPALLNALLYLRAGDDSVDLTQYGGYGVGDSCTTATAEILSTLAGLGATSRPGLPRLHAMLSERAGEHTRAQLTSTIEAIERAPERTAQSCCGGGVSVHVDELPEPTITEPPSEQLLELTLEDHAGERLRFEQFFTGQPSIVTFFYTRCDNPAKCPLTIQRFGALQRSLHDAGLDGRVRTAAISYDPEYDAPERLRRFAESWGMPLSSDHRMFRSLGDFLLVQRHFRLGVGFGPSLINRHQIETYVIDERGRVRERFERLRWTEAELIAAAVLLAPGQTHRVVSG